jgi:muramoyltetrapeptide carboxypeptidase
MTGRPSIHGPMPASSLWGQLTSENSAQDVMQLISLMKGTQTGGHFDLDDSRVRSRDAISGKIFGGCLSVLTSLIGTPYLPKNLSGHILLFEDVGENPGRVLRMLNQWKHAGYFAGVKALVFGAFTDLGSSLPNNAHVLFDEIAKRFDLPVFAQAQFGHVAPNYPFIIGSDASIVKDKLVWTFGAGNLS